MQTEHILGRGACKTVFKALDEEEGQEVAWNRVHEFMTSKEERERLIAEIRVLNQLKHKNIMTFFDSWLDPKTQQINFITEMFTSGTLRQCAPPPSLHASSCCVPQSHYSSLCRLQVTIPYSAPCVGIARGTSRWTVRCSSAGLGRFSADW